MCGRYTLGPRVPGEFDARFGGHVDIRALRRYNVAPTEAVPVVRRRRGAAAGGGSAVSDRETVNAHWGLLPPWATSRGERLKPINARVETLTEKKLFAPLVAQAEHRVLVLADGWYEWMRREDPSSGGGSKVPFHHTVDGGEPVAFAGLAREIRLKDAVAGVDPHDRPYGGAGVDERTLVSVAIVTCAASPSAARLHDRMPAVLAGPDEEAAWLSSDVDGRDAIALCVPLADERLTIAPASPLVNSVRSADGPWLLDPDVTAAPDEAPAGAETQTQLDLPGTPDA